MKKLTLLSLLIASAAFSGTEVAPPTIIPTPVENVIESIFNSKSLALAVYPSYGRDIVVNGKSNPWGFGAALLYPVAEYAYAGIRLDYLSGQLWAPSATVGAKYTLKNVWSKPTIFSVGGLVYTANQLRSGEQTSSVGAIAGIGIEDIVWQDKSGAYSFSLFAEGEKWTNLPGTILHVGVAGGVKF